MDKEYLYLRVRTEDSVQKTPNPKENYVLIYPVVQQDEDNNMSIHLKDHLGNMHKVSGSTQKINLLQNQLDTLQGDLISILQEILGYSDTSESSSSMSSDALQGGGESSESSQSSSSVGQIEQYIPMGSGTWEDPYNWYGDGFMSDDYPENVTISFENNKGVMSRNYDNSDMQSESALIAVYLQEGTIYSIEIYDISYSDTYLYILDSNKEILLQADDGQSGGGFTYEIQHSEFATAAYFKPNVTGKYYIEVATYDGDICTAKVAVNPKPLRSLTSPITD